MFRKIVDVLKEVFWIKPSRKKTAPVRKKVAVSKRKQAYAKKKVLKKTVVKTQKPKAPLKPKSKLVTIKKPLKSTAKSIDPSLVEVGEITHYFERIKVCVVKLNQGTVLIGDKLTVLGAKTKFVQKVWSMQVESIDVKVAKKGQLIGLKVDKAVVVGDKVYK